MEKASKPSGSGPGGDTHLALNRWQKSIAAQTRRATKEAWVKPSENPDNPGVVFAHTNNSSWHQYAFIVIADGRLYFISGGSSFEQGGANSSSEEIPLGEWSHITMTYDGNAVQFYLNGENIST